MERPSRPYRKILIVIASFIPIILYIGFLFVASKFTPDETPQKTQQTSTIPPLYPPKRQYKIPDDVQYTTTHNVNGNNLSVTVKINKRARKEVLAEIAEKIKAEAAFTYDRTFVLFYLPHMTLDNGAWATAHFTPNLKVTLQGLTEDEFQQLKAGKSKDQLHVLGEWVEEVLKSRLTLRVDGDDTFMDRHYINGLTDSSQVFKRKFPGGSGYEGSIVGEESYAEINADGNLVLRSKADGEIVDILTAVD